MKPFYTISCFVLIFNINNKAFSQINPKLISATITFYTASEDKDWDTKPICNLLLDGRIIAYIDCCSSNNNGDFWDKGTKITIPLIVKENANINSINSRGKLVLGGKAGSHGAGNDRWKFNASFQMVDSNQMPYINNWNDIPVLSRFRSQEQHELDLKPSPPSTTSSPPTAISPPLNQNSSSVWFHLYGTGKSFTSKIITISALKINISKGFYTNSGLFQGVKFQGIGANAGIIYTLQYGPSTVLPGTYKVSILGRCSDNSLITHRATDNQEIHAEVTYN